ncbi:hypothetical protein C3L33_20145, partial [Rhododendron williamsianum]
MKGQELPTVLLESFASFVESMSMTMVNEVQEDVLRQATLSIEDFEQVGLELSWLKKRLEEAKKANKHAESLVYVDLCETALKVGRAKVRELEEGLVKAKAELEDCSTDLPNSLAVNDYLLLDVVARDEDLMEQIGRDKYFDLVDHNKVRSFRIKRQMPFNLFKEEVAKEFGIPVQFQRFWLWAKRLNNTYRPSRHLTPQQEARPVNAFDFSSFLVGHLREATDKVKVAELNLFLEVELGQGLRPIPPPVKSADDILLFFKLYDPLKEELRYFNIPFLGLVLHVLGLSSPPWLVSEAVLYVVSYVGRLYVKAGGMPVEILAKINRLAGFAPDEDIQLFEEIKYEPLMCEVVNKMVTFRDSELEDGDIICFQKSSQAECCGQFEHPDAPSFLDYVNYYQIKPEHYRKRRRLISSEPEPTERSRGTISGGSTMQTHSANAPAGKIRFLAYWVSSEASLLLERILNIHKDTYTNFSMKDENLQTVLLESFAAFIETMSTTKVYEVQEEVLRRATVSVKDFEQVGLELSWMKKRLETAKKVNKCTESRIYVDLCETALKVGRAKVRELEEGLVKAKAELEDWSTNLPNSLAANDYLLMDVV